MSPDAPDDGLSYTRLIGGAEPSVPLVSSRADAVVDSLGRSILSGEIGQGEPLSVSALAQRLSVSAATVRAALAALESMHLVEPRFNRASVVTTPTPAWFVAVAAECVGLSATAVDLGLAHATDAEMNAFVERASEVAALWTDADQDQNVGAEGLWDLLDLLAAFSRNDYLRALHTAKRRALLFGIRSLSRPRNPAMLQSVVEALVAAARERDRVEAADIVRDLYTFVVDGVTEP
ncbi:GntR family transcriptional regulator [Microbacterium sp. 1.5R]|uniref:GntR family transcriptional regulator n=1 Tax=Microbacterium sp. 1.5R TaxID=1916917 RepID=UPI001642B8EB|nr:GntR family transcriptional regulator [Microbacterium sp. 1.5R]